MENLPEGVTAEMLEEYRKKHEGFLKVASLTDSEGESHGDIVVGRPSAYVIGQFEKFLDKDPMKAREILVKGVLCSRREEFINTPKNTEKYAACFDACAKMLPVGKSELKNL